MNDCARYWIKKLKLSKHPEGGYYAETYRSAMEIERNGINRAVCTAIYYLLELNDFSAFHRIDADELWHHYAGEELTIHMISPQGEYCVERLNSDGRFQVLVPAGYWFAAELSIQEGYSLVGCTVAPGFIFDAFELAKASELTYLNPENKDLIERLTLS